MIPTLRPTLLRLSGSAVRSASASSSARKLPIASTVASRHLSTSLPALAVRTRYTPEHEWVRFDDETNIGVVGITDYAQNSLGDVVYVELPSEKSELTQGEQIGAVESVKAASDIYCPVSGVVTAVNDKLSDQPALLNKSPLEDGWLCKIKLSKPEEFETLLDDKAYAAHTSDDH